MLEPVGPLPPGVYWRRRAVALMLAVGLLLGLGWFATRSLGGGTGPDTTPLAAEGPETSTSVPSASSAPPSSSSAAPPPADPVALFPTPPSTPPPAPPPPPPPPPGPPGPCADESIGVVAETGAPEYRVGQRPLLRLVITNTSPVACIRDVDPALQELLVFTGDGVTRLWSSNDCATGGRPDVRTLAPGEQVRSELFWGGRTSAVGCPAERQSVAPGDYRVIAKLGPITSEPAALRLLP